MEGFYVGMVGCGIQQSLAPRIHMSEARQLGVNYSYKLFDLLGADEPEAELDELISAAVRMRFDGLVVTHPFKQIVVRRLEAITADAKLLGAVNVITFNQGVRGFNTDWLGFHQALSDQIPGADLSSVLQIGAGGAGAATAYALLLSGAEKLYISDAEPGRARQLVANMNGVFLGDRCAYVAEPEEVASHCSGVVNATPVGMDAYPGSPLALELLGRRHWVADVIYFPRITPLIQRARELGLRCMNGEAMTVSQAAEQMRLFCGHEGSRQRMLASLREYLQ